MGSLTCNQAIMLLQIYRGTLADEFKIGTHDNDLAHLKAKGFIENGTRVDARPVVSWGGSQLVKHMLTLPA